MLILVKATDETGLAVTLQNLQSQTNEMIFVEGGLWVRPIIRRFTTGLILTGEVCTIASDTGTLVIPSNYIFSRTLVTNIKRASKLVSGNICPVVSHLSDGLNPNYRPFAKMVGESDIWKVQERGDFYYEAQKEEVYQIDEVVYPLRYTPISTSTATQDSARIGRED
jgi:hypothetical protein